MTIKNIGSKIISIGTTVLMPDASMSADKKTAETPAIKAMVKAGLLAVEEDAKQSRAPKQGKEDDAAKSAEEAKKKAEEEAKKKAEEEAKKQQEATGAQQ